MNVAGIPELSIVVPVYNEAGNLETLTAAIGAAVDAVATWELIFVDDGSRDESASLAATIASRDPRVRTLAFSRNFGKEAAILAGLEAARGRAVAVMDADMQHPPELLPLMLVPWREGRADIVDGVKRSRGDETVLHRGAVRLFNHMMSAAGGAGMQGSSDYKLLDRRVATLVASFPERTRFFRALTEWAGFRHAQVEYDVAPRRTGHSAWTLRGLMRYSLTGIVAFSSAPLRAIATLGLVTILFSLALGADTLYMKLSGRAVEGFTTVLLSVAFFSGAIILCLGIMGEYLARMYDELKRRPPYILRENLRSGEHIRQEDRGDDDRA